MKLDFFTQLKALFNTPVVADEEVKNFADAKTADGMILKITPEIAVDGMVEVIAEDGTTSAPQAGELALEDGSILVLDETGKILEVKAAAAPVEEEMKTEEEVVLAEVEVETETEAPADIEARLSALEQAVQMIIDGLKGQEMKTETVEEVKMEVDNKEEVIAELNKVKVELSKYKSAPSLSFKIAALTTETPREPALTPMQKVIRDLAEKSK